MSENEDPAIPGLAAAVGRTTITVQTDLADRAGRRVAQVTQVQAVLGGQHGR